MPAPLPASLPFSVTSACASLISWRTSVEVWLARSLTSSPKPRSRGVLPGSWVAMAQRGRRVLAVQAGVRRSPRAGAGERRRRRSVGPARARSAAPPVRLVGAPAVAGRAGRRARLVATGARGLQEARGGEPEREPAGDDRPRALAAEVLDVAQDRVAVGALQVVAERLGALGGLLGELRRLVLALVAQLLGDAADVAGRRADALAGLRRPLVDLVAEAALGLLARAFSLAFSLACSVVELGPLAVVVPPKLLMARGLARARGASVAPACAM